MDRRQCVIANVKYQSAKGKGAGQLKGILRYFQYRNDRDGHIPQQQRRERWVDHGLGNNFQSIAACCEALKSEHVQAFTLVINPNPDLIALIPEDQRDPFTRDLTERTISAFFEARDIPTPEWSYVLHRRATREDGRDNPHTHVILPGTYESWADGGRLPLYFNNRKKENHIELLHEVAQQEMDHLLDRYVGVDWEQRYGIQYADVAELDLIQTTELEELRAAPDEPPHHAIRLGENTHWQIWIAVQGDLDPDLYHVGLVARHKGKEHTEQGFIPYAENLTQYEAEILASYMKRVVLEIDRENVLAQVTEVMERFSKDVNFRREITSMLCEELNGEEQTVPPMKNILANRDISFGLSV